MQIFYITLLVSCAYFSFGQTKKMEDWTKKHPTVLIINSIDVNVNLISKLKKRNLEYIIINEVLTKEDVAFFESSKNVSTNLENIQEIESIKQWQARNSTIQIVTRSEFEEASEEKQIQLIQNHALIINKSKISLKDIKEYELTH